MIREPVVAGSFYPGLKTKLQDELNKMVKPGQQKYQAKGIVSPHAGYIYSGKVAGEVFSVIDIPERAVVLAPNHTGVGEPFSLWPGGKWLTPLGETEIDDELTGLIRDSIKLVKEDTTAHLREHSAEVQLPFLQYLRHDIKIAAVIIASSSLRELKSFGKSLGEVLKNYSKSCLVIASSDMTHYESHEIAQKKDNQAIEEILALDEDKLYEVIHNYNISMCGYGPTIAMISCCKALGAKEARLIKYQTSAEASGDYSQVVGYAGIVVN